MTLALLAAADPAATLVRSLIGCFLLAFLIGNLIGALILRTATAWVAEIEISFGRAYFTVLIATIFTVFVEFAIGAGIGVVMVRNGKMPTPESLQPFHDTIVLISMGVNFLCSATVYGILVREPRTDIAVGWPTGFKLSVVSYLISFAIFLVIVAIIFGLMYGLGYHFDTIQHTFVPNPRP